MAITRKPSRPASPASTEAADACSSGAPDADVGTSQVPRRVRRGRKVQITLTFAEPVRERGDGVAALERGWPADECDVADEKARVAG